MKFINILLPFIWLLLYSHTKADTGCSFDPRTPNSWVTYQRFVTTCQWSVATKQLSIIQKASDQQAPVITVQYTNGVTPSLSTNPFLQATRFFGPVIDPTQDLGVINNAVSWYSEGSNQIGWYLGDIGWPDKGITVTPGEPMIPLNPVGGEHYEIDHEVANSQSGKTVNYIMHTSYWTVGHYATWGAFTDCWRTTLVEYHGPAIQAIYNYIFARGLGLVDFWWGVPDGSGGIAGHEMYAIAFGN
jgi:hypothetical protein